MVHEQTPIALEVKSISDCIESVLAQDAPTLLVACSSREDFYRHLSTEFSPASTEEAAGNSEGHSAPLPPLLNPTIRLIARSRNVQLVFTPSLMHLRAYASVLPFGKLQDPPRKLVFLDLLELHRSASEFSAQGISRTLALLVDVAAQCRVPLEIMEVCKPAQVGEDAGTSTSLFAVRVPILSRSPRSGEERAWAGRDVEIKSIMSKWFQVTKMLTG